MKQQQELLGYMLGHATAMLWLACIVFASIASVVMYKYRINKRDRESNRTPADFSWPFFWKDTRPRMIATFVMILLALRFLFIWEMDPGWNIGFAILIGFISDRLGKIFDKAANVSESLVDSKIDEVAGKLKAAEAKVDVAKNELKDAGKEINQAGDDLQDIKNQQP